jgi:redox-sensitive bicupin YhaK (pirin superfamily)
MTKLLSSEGNFLMSITPALEPNLKKCAGTPEIEAILEGRAKDLGGFTVRRLLPSHEARKVGPFVFFDHMGPADFPPGHGIDVRPHPHINLATVTYLFEGEIVHRDSLGSNQTIRPGEINWMTAGRGIVHSERTGSELRAKGSRLHGIQLWVGLPKVDEEAEPEFHHHSVSELPEVQLDGTSLRVLVGNAYGTKSPVKTFSSLFYVDAHLPKGTELPLPSEHQERAAYLVEGKISCGAETLEPSRMIVFTPGSSPKLFAESNAQLVLLGGTPLDGERHLWWNFVSSSKDRIEQAKKDWKEGKFGKVPGDEVEFIPLPD